MITWQDIRRAVALEHFDGEKAQSRMAPGSRGMFPPATDRPKEAAVLILIYPDAASEALHIVLTRRTDSLRGHSGQISFPGGRCDPEDPSYTATALRETCEELGICTDWPLTITGMLTSCYIPPTNYNVHPVVAFSADAPIIVPNPVEVAEVIALPVRDLLRAENKQTEIRTLHGRTIEVPYYNVSQHKVWGATAIMLSELEHRLRAVLPASTLAALH